MKVYLGADHAGYGMKENLKEYLKEKGYEVVDKGAFHFNPDDDYPDFIREVAQAVVNDPNHGLGIILGASGQGEAMCANRFGGIRAAVYYGPASRNQKDAAGNSLDIIASARAHNNANILSLGGRFLSADEARMAVKIFLTTSFSGEERHIRRIQKIDGSP